MFLEQDAVLGLFQIRSKIRSICKKDESTEERTSYHVSLSGRNGSVDQLTKRRFIAAAFRHWSVFCSFFLTLFGNSKTQMEY